MTPALLLANRRNAQLSTGPRTPEGKALIAQNARTHGLGSVVPVLPGLEKREEWEAHRRAFLAAVQPEGYVELTLAERAALLAWRLGRVVRYETAAFAQAFAGEKQARDRAVAGLRTGRRLRRLVDRLSSMGDTEPIKVGFAEILLTAVAVDARVDPMAFSVPDAPEGGWTAGTLRKAMEAIVVAAGRDVDDLDDRLRAFVRRLEEGALRDRGGAPARAIPERAERFDADIDRVLKYEGHLDRLLHRTLHELQRLQAMRLGMDVRLPVAVDLDVAVGPRGQERNGHG